MIWRDMKNSKGENEMQDFRMETFLAVCRTMNYTRAAKELGLTQPAVSQHIHYLEKVYGVELFVQNGKKIALTAAGEILRNSVLTMKHDEIHMKKRMQQAAGGEREYFFGATLSVAEFMIAEDLEQFIRNHPNCHIQMQVANTKVLLEKIDSGELDFAIVEGEFPREEYDYLFYGKEEYVAAGNRKTAEKYAGAGFEELLAERLILRERGSGTREILENILRQRGIVTSQFANVMELGNIGIIQEMVRAGLGITFFYKATIRETEKEIQVIPVKDFKMMHAIMFVFRKNSIFKKDYEEIYKEFKGINRK